MPSEKLCSGVEASPLSLNDKLPLEKGLACLSKCLDIKVCLVLTFITWRFVGGDITLCIKIDKPLMIYRFLAMVRNDAHNDVKYI